MSAAAFAYGHHNREFGPIDSLHIIGFKLHRAFRLSTYHHYQLLFQAMAPEVTTLKRVQEADPNGGRCLVQNLTMIVDFYHCISRNTDNKTVCCLKPPVFIKK